MTENDDAAMMDFLNNVPTEKLIEFLRTRRELTEKNVIDLQSLRPMVSGDSSLSIISTRGSEENKPSVEKFTKLITKKNVKAKLPAGSMIDGVEINRNLVGGFYDLGPDEILLSPLENYVFRLFGSIIYPTQDELPDLMKSHFLSVTPSTTDKGRSVLGYYFFQDSHQIDGRGYCTPGEIYIEMPTSAIVELLGEISANPDLLEDFYQNSFPLLDSANDRRGMRRIKADGYYLIPESKLEEVGKISRYNTYETIAATIKFFKKLEKHLYQNGPYGTGDEFKPRR